MLIYKFEDHSFLNCGNSELDHLDPDDKYSYYLRSNITYSPVTFNIEQVPIGMLEFKLHAKTVY